MTARTIHPQHCPCRACTPSRNRARWFVAFVIASLLVLFAGLRGVL